MRGASSTVVVTESPDGAFTVNTTITFTCPDNTTQNARCEYAPVGGAQWVGTLQRCNIAGKKYKTNFNSYISCVLFLGPTSGSSTGGDSSDDDKNRNILIGILVPVILILLVVVIILTIGVIIVVKR